MIKNIIKRNGKEEAFDYQKIYVAIKKANEAVWSNHPERKMSDNDITTVTSDVVKTMEETEKRHVEEIQDFVEFSLMKFGWTDTAKAYILYRSEHTKIREAKDYLMETFQKLTFRDSLDEEIKRENANINTNSAMGTMLKYGTESSNYFINNYILPKDLADAHVGGDIHIHDKDFFMLTETCCQIDLLELFKNGFNTGHGFLREPGSIRTAAALACIAIQSNQNDMHGGQAVPHFDYCMAPYVKKTYDKILKKAFIEYVCINIGLITREMAEKYFEAYIELKNNINNVPSINIDNYSEIDGNALNRVLTKAIFYAHEYAYRETEHETYQAMEALVHNLNTMNSRAGAQVPFSSLNYGTSTSPEGRMVIKNLLLATQAGLGNGETPIFPVQIFKVKEGVNYNPGDPNYDLFQLAMETSSKRLFPNFSFLDAPFNKQFYTTPDDWNHEVAYMGCRTRVIGNIYDPTREVTCGRGNLSFTSINLPRLGIEAKGNEARLFELLEKQLDLVIRELKFRLKIQGRRYVKNYPFLMGNGIWLDSDKLDWESEIAEILKHGTLTIGFIGLAECLKAFMGVHHGESKEAQKLGLRLIGRIRERCDEQSRADKLNYSCIGTPAESLSGRFVPLDRARYGVIPEVTDRDYYTNSFHIPVYFPITAARKIELEAPYHALTNGGHITYVELDGDTCKNLEAFESIIRYMHDQGIGYGSINHPLDRDPVCGYTGVINDVCPRCGRREGEGVSYEKLEELRRKYPGVPKQSSHRIP